MEQVHKWGVFEATLASEADYEDPFHDVRVTVRLAAPSGARREVDAFWNGHREWRFRFSPDEPGRWRWIKL